MKLLHERIAEYAALFPDKAAAEDSDGVLTYWQLAEKSASVAEALAGIGFRGGDAAAVYVPYTKDIATGIVSILRAGGICVPLDEKHPAKRQEYILENCEAKAILTVRELWEKKPLDVPENRVIFLDVQTKAPEGLPCQATLTEESPALLLYTSGTTGKPKGVLYSHSFVTHIADYMDVFEGTGMNADTRSGIMSSFSFIGSQTFLLGPLVKGGTACIAPEEARHDSASLYRFIRMASITHIFVPSALAAILAEDYDIRNMRIFAAGEKLRSFHAAFPGNCLINSYGSTEMRGVMSKRIFENETRITVGKPYPGAEARIVGDDTLDPVPAGEAGELLISDGSMARAYYKEPELSAEKWVRADGKTWFRTGDRARCTEDGEYEILGRTDHMIKVRGFRVETGEVESQIAEALSRTGQHGIGQLVVAKKTVSGSEHLCCYYEGQQALDSGAVSEEIAKSLPEYMTPHFWIRMDRLPRNMNGKVVRDQLPQPKLERKALSAIDNEVTGRLVWTAAEVLEISEPIGPDDTFTGLGGTSLTALVLAERLREQGIKVTVAQILRLNVLRKISEAADVAWEQFWTPAEFDKVKAGFEQRGEHILKVLPLSARQNEMLYHSMIHPDRSDSLNAVVLQLDSIVAEAHIRQALDILSEENEELRSAIVYHDFVSVRQVITDRKIPLEMAKAGAFDSREMIELHNRLINEPFDPQYSSLMRVSAIYSGKETFLYIITHGIGVGKLQRRALLARLMALLENKCPDDPSIREWREMLETGLSAAETDAAEEQGRVPADAIRGEAPPEIYVYSENDGPKLVFVHTGNTGSEAYYRLAERIGDRISFAVIEPFNLYHPDEVRHGIREIAAKYIEILKRHQPEGPYLLGGWCYGGVVAHEMACQLEQAEEQVRHLFMLDSHALGNRKLATLSGSMSADINREYFETCPLFAELREKGMLESVVNNAVQVSQDLMNHRPSLYRGPATYFKPRKIPANVSAESRKYWETMMGFSAGNYERYCLKDQLKIILTPDEHDLMMEKASLDIIVPEILKDICGHSASLPESQEK